MKLRERRGEWILLKAATALARHIKRLFAIIKSFEISSFSQMEFPSSHLRCNTCTEQQRDWSMVHPNSLKSKRRWKEYGVTSTTVFGVKSEPVIKSISWTFLAFVHVQRLRHQIIERMDEACWATHTHTLTSLNVPYVRFVPVLLYSNLLSWSFISFIWLLQSRYNALGLW